MKQDHNTAKKKIMQQARKNLNKLQKMILRNEIPGINIANVMNGGLDE